MNNTRANQLVMHILSWAYLLEQADADARAKILSQLAEDVAELQALDQESEQCTQPITP